MDKAHSSHKDPLVAGLLAIIPGAGHVYCGESLRGIAYLLGTILGLFLFLTPGLFIWAASVPDVVLCVRRRNRLAPPMLHPSLVKITDDAAPPVPSPRPEPARQEPPVAETPPDPWTESAR